MNWFKTAVPALFAFVISVAASESVTDDWNQFRFRGAGVAEMEVVKTSGQSFPSAAKIAVKAARPLTYDVQLAAPCALPLELDGEVVEVIFHARGLSPLPGKNYAQVQALVEVAGPPWSKFVFTPVQITGNTWKRYHAFGRSRPAKKDAKRDFGPGETQVGFNLAYGPQTLELAGVEVVKHKGVTATEGLPISPFYYPGREANAAWRAEAEKRIETIRKGDFTLKLEDAAGNPLAGVPVRVEMVRHRFPFGSCINRWMAVDDDNDNQQRYLDEFAKWFNQAVFESSMKWHNGFAVDDEVRSVMKFLKENRISLRGHCTLWPSWQMTPPWLRLLEKRPDAIREVVRDHIFYQIGTLKDDVVEMDLVNEPYTHNDLIKLLGGEKVIGDWFRTARQAAPDLPLYINDFGILVSADKPEDEHRKHYHEVISRLLQEKAPLGGIGMQSHFTDPQAPENMLKILDEYGKYGLPIKLTEYDFNTFDEALAGDYMRDILYVAFSHPAVEGFLMWGFWDGQHWLGNAPIFRADWSLKPSGKVFDELVHHRWSTRLEGKSDATGIYAGRGFYGDYRVSVTTGDGKTVEVPFTLEPGITNYTVKVK